MEVHEPRGVVRYHWIVAGGIRENGFVRLWSAGLKGVRLTDDVAAQQTKSSRVRTRPGLGRRCGLRRGKEW
jgi:hypothetical protein